MELTDVVTDLLDSARVAAIFVLLVGMFGVVLMIWFVVTLHRIARNLAEQTRLLRTIAQRDKPSPP